LHGNDHVQQASPHTESAGTGEMARFRNTQSAPPLNQPVERHASASPSPHAVRWGDRIEGKPDAERVYFALEASALAGRQVAGNSCPGVTLLIDECLSPLLESVANDFGYVAHAVHHRGWSSLTDPELLHHLIRGELTLVTNNRSDWVDLLGNQLLHPGLIILIDNVPRAEQIRGLSRCLEVLSGLRSMVNTVIEVDREGCVVIYDLP